MSRGRRKYLYTTAILVILAVAASVIWLRPRAVTDPFDAKTLAAATFPLYYPTQLPSGYRIDPSSVSVPQAGVVVFDMKGPANKLIYMSQESRPTTFNFGGYYQNFADLHEKVISLGTIAVGRINNNKTEIGSLATDKTWIIVNTKAPVPPDQFTAMLNSLVVAH